jgi:hypothetical protein
MYGGRGGRILEKYQTFDRIVDALTSFAEKSPDRMPFSDWVFTSQPSVKGFRCRPVQGGFFAKMLL